MRPDCTAGPGEDSRETEPPLSGVLDRTERLLRLAFVAESEGEPDLDIGRVNVTSDLLRLRPPKSPISFFLSQSLCSIGRLTVTRGRTQSTLRGLALRSKALLS